MSTAAVNKPTQTNKPTSPMSAAPMSTAEVAKRARAARKPVPKDETPDQTFKRLAVPRVEKALKACKQLKALARLKPSDEYRKKVFEAVRTALTVAEESWKVGEKTTDTGFSL
jgi:hypothetical protein